MSDLPRLHVVDGSNALSKQTAEAIVEKVGFPVGYDPTRVFAFYKDPDGQSKQLRVGGDKWNIHPGMHARIVRQLNELGWWRSLADYGRDALYHRCIIVDELMGHGLAKTGPAITEMMAAQLETENEQLACMTERVVQMAYKADTALKRANAMRIVERGIADCDRSDDARAAEYRSRLVAALRYLT